MAGAAQSGATGRGVAVLTVHIGLPKCGSTSIQQALVRAVPALARAGVHVPNLGGAFPNHNRLVRKLSGGDADFGARADPAVWERLACEVRGCGARHVVLTAELFTSGGLLTATPGAASAERVAALARDCGLEVRPVAYIRPQAELLESLYAQMVRKSRTVVPFDLFVEEMLESDRLDFAAILGPWRERFPRLRVWPLEATRAVGGPAAHFLGLIGGTADVARHMPPANVRPGAETLEALRLAGGALADRGMPFAERARRLPRLECAYRRASTYPQDVRFAPLTAARAAAVAAHFADSNARFAVEYGVPADFADSSGTFAVEHGVAAPDGRRPHRSAWGKRRRAAVVTLRATRSVSAALAVFRGTAPRHGLAGDAP